jgi:hypothetical protein
MEVPSYADSSEAGARMPPLTKLHKRFAATKESLRDAGPWLLDADETTHTDDLACVLFSSFYYQL